MKKKHWLIGLLAVALSVSCALVACGKSGRAAELIGFDVPAEETVTFGDTYTLPELTVTDAAGNLYVPAVTVKAGEQDVTVLSGGFQIRSLADHVITYTVTVSEKDVQTKTTTLKVADRREPVVTFAAFDRYIVKGTAWTLPAASVLDDADTGLKATVELYLGETKLTPTDGKYTLTQTGVYTLKGTATDTAGNVGTTEEKVYVREPAMSGEVEAFADPYGPFDAVGNDVGLKIKSGYTQDAVGGETPKDGRYFAWFSTEEINSENDVNYPGFKLIPRISKEDLTEISLDTTYKITFRVYHTAAAEHYLYMRWSGSQKRISDAIPGNTWTTVELTVMDLLSSYENVAQGKQLFFYVGNDPLYITHEKFTTYVSGIWITQDAEVSFGSTFGNGDYNVGDTLDLTDMGLETWANSEEVTDVTYNVVIASPTGTHTTITDQTEIELTEFGNYTVTATIAGSDTLTGAATKTVHVGSTLASVQAKAAELKDVADKTTAEFAAQIDYLSRMYDALPADDKAAYTRAALINAVFEPTPVEDKVWYTDSMVGLLQAQLMQVNAGDSTFKAAAFAGSLDYSTEEKHGTEAGSLKLTVGAGGLFYLSINPTVRLSGVADISAYESLKFFVKADVTNANSSKDWNIRVFDGIVDGRMQAVNNTNVKIGQVFSTNAKSGEWIEVTIPLNGISSWNNLMIGFRPGDWSRINAGSTFHISSIVAVPKKQLAFKDDFLTEEYLQGDALPGGAMTAIAKCKGQDVTEGVQYEVTDPSDNTTEITDPTAAFTFMQAGTYTFRVFATSGALQGMEATKSTTVLAGVVMTPEELNTKLTEMIATLDKTTTQYADDLKQTRAAYLKLSDAEKAQVDFNKYQQVQIGGEKVIAFDSATGLTQLEYKVTENGETVSSIQGTPAFTTEIPVGLPMDYGAGATKLEPTAHYYLVMLDFKDLSATFGDISRYDSLEFYVYRDMERAFRVRGKPLHGGTVQNLENFAGKTWSKITLDLVRYNSWQDIRIWLTDNAWTGTDSCAWYVSAIFAMPKVVAEVEMPAYMGVGAALNPTVTVSRGTVIATSGVTTTYTVAAAGEEPIEMQAGHTFTAAGVYTVTATVTVVGLSEPLVVTKTVRVVQYHDDGVALFTADNAAALIPGAQGIAGSLTEETTVGVKTGQFIKFSTGKDGTANAYPGVGIPLSISKEQLTALKDEGYTNIEIEVYMDIASARWRSGTRAAPANFIGWIYGSTWTTLEMKSNSSYTKTGLEYIIDYYDDIMTGKRDLFFIGNAHNADDGDASDIFDVYIGSITVTKPATTA